MVTPIDKKVTTGLHFHVDARMATKWIQMFSSTRRETKKMTILALIK